MNDSMNDYTWEPQPYIYDCPRCQYGRCYPGHATYTQVYHGQLLSAPKTPAFICDVCGYQEFDYRALNRLQTILGITETADEELESNEDTTPAKRSPSTSGKPGKPPQ